MFAVNILSVLVAVTVVSASSARICKTSFHSGTDTPNDELMSALYIADPDPSTGHMSFNGAFTGDSMYAELVSSTVDYTTWLVREHDANEAITNLWSYIANMVVSDVFTLYGHFQVTEQQRNSRPTGVIDFTALESHFYEVSNNFDSYNNTWPYSCFSKDFFWSFKYALQNLDNIVYDSELEYVKGQFVHSREPMPIKAIRSLSKLGVDNRERQNAVEGLFDTTLLNYIPGKAVSNVFDHSQLVWKSISKLAEGTSSLDSWIRDQRYVGVKDTVTARCLARSGSPVATEYYCKAKELAVKLQGCGSLSDVTPCLYDPLFQDYFEKGRFGSYDELTIIARVIEQTRIVLTSLKDKVSAQDESGITNFVQDYSPYATIAVSQCVHSWPKSFDCQNNVGCPGIIDIGGCNRICRMNTMYRFDCLIRFLIDQSQNLLDAKSSSQWYDPIVQRAKHGVMIWLSYLPMANYVNLASNDVNDVIVSTQRTLNDYVTSYDITGLTTFSTTLPPVTLVPRWARNAACQTTASNQAYTIYCTLDPLLNSVAMFLKAFKHGRQSSVKILNPTVDYKELIKQLQLDRVQQYINRQTQSYFNDISSQLEENFGSLSSYFSNLADYDRQKVKADIAYINDRLVLFSGQVNTLSHKVASSFSVVLDLAINANIAELSQKYVKLLGVSFAQICNPLSELLGGPGILDVMDAIDDLAQTGVTSAVLIRLGDHEIPELANLAQEMATGFLVNKKHLDNAKALIDGIRDGKSDIDDVAVAFLEKDDEYDPQVSASDITLYGEKFATVAETLCEAAFSGDTVASALFEIQIANSGQCTKMRAMIAELITVYEQLYDFQFDLMDALSDAVRANIAYEKANDMKLIYTSGARVDQAFLQSTAINTYMVSVMHVWQVVTEYCDVLTYTDGGVVPTVCDTAITSPSHENVARVIAHDLAIHSTCEDERTNFYDIPTRSSGAGDKGYIDLEQLYNREEVTFQIPNHQWLQTHGWVGASEGEKAIYISRFELYLPPMSSTSEHTVELAAQPSLPNYLTKGGTKYILPVNGYNCRYTENSHNCYKDNMKNPYTLCNTNPLVQLCVISEGNVDRKIQPSIYNEWKVSAKSIPLYQVAPMPTTDFKLQVAMTMCIRDLANRKRRDVAMPLPETAILNRNRRGVQHCCSSNHYWNGAACNACPSGSSQRHNGYYCQ